MKKIYTWLGVIGLFLLLCFLTTSCTNTITSERSGWVKREVVTHVVSEKIVRPYNTYHLHFEDGGARTVPYSTFTAVKLGDTLTFVYYTYK